MPQWSLCAEPRFSGAAEKLNPPCPLAISFQSYPGCAPPPAGGSGRYEARSAALRLVQDRARPWRPILRNKKYVEKVMDKTKFRGAVFPVLIVCLMTALQAASPEAS